MKLHVLPKARRRNRPASPPQPPAPLPAPAEESKARAPVMATSSPVALPGYDLGDAGVPRHFDADAPRRTAAEEAAALGVGDAAFVLRSNRGWVYAVLVKTIAEEGKEALQFDVGTKSLKTIPKSAWGKYIRTINCGPEEFARLRAREAWDFVEGRSDGVERSHQPSSSQPSSPKDKVRKSVRRNERDKRTVTAIQHTKKVEAVSRVHDEEGSSMACSVSEMMGQCQDIWTATSTVVRCDNSLVAEPRDDYEVPCDAVEEEELRDAPELAMPTALPSVSIERHKTSVVLEDLIEAERMHAASKSRGAHFAAE
ncbi:hypothetical protein ACHAXT_007045 [Thalassiosira profunda]